MPNTLASAEKSVLVNADDSSQPIVAQIPQGYEGKLNIRFLPGRDFDLGTTRLGCRPRKGAPRREADPVALPPELKGKLRDANTKVVAWLNADPANAKLFLASPVEALTKAGVELSRAEQKIIDRTHRENTEASVVAPGVRITDLTTVADTTGKVGTHKPGPGGKSIGEVDCGFTRKGKE